MKNNNIIFKDTETIDYLKNTLEEMCNILNDNHKKVLAFNKNLSYKITLYHSFYKVGQDNSTITSKCYSELKEIIKAKSPFYTESMVSDYHKKLSDYLHFNEYKKTTGGFYYISDANFDEEEYTKEKAKQNILSIGRNISYRYDVGFYDKLELAEYYILFDKDSFIINEERLNEFIESKTYKVKNTKQQKCLEIMQNISKEFKELQALNPYFNKDLFTDIRCELIPDNKLVNRIYEVN